MIPSRDPAISDDQSSDPLATPAIKQTMEDPQTHLIYLLLDSNLPTGGFVASSGLESWVKHGFLGHQAGYDAAGSHSGSGSRSSSSVQSKVSAPIAAVRITDFIDAELENYARATGIYVRQAWETVHQHFEDLKGRSRTMTRERCGKCGKRKAASSSSHSIEGQVTSADTATPSSEALESTLQDILDLDKYHEATLLSHVSRRASKAQGVAILTLHSKGLSRPPGFPIFHEVDREPDSQTAPSTANEEAAGAVVEGYKRLIRRGTAPGHLAICWGVMTAALGLSLEKSYHLYLFLHARSLLSAAVRLNAIGPYLSSQLLLHPIKSILDRYSISSASSRVREDSNGSDQCACLMQRSAADEGFWNWTREAEAGPATTWPLGEVLIARHDLQHSRIFNS